MKTKEEQIEELKATAVKLQKQIEALEKPEQWEPKCEPCSPSEMTARRSHGRLLAYVREYGGDWEADWESMHQEKCYVYYGHNSSKRWKYASVLKTHIGGTVYMSQDCAVGLANKLNSGEVVL
jgi:hypothetical protein